MSPIALGSLKLIAQGVTVGPVHFADKFDLPVMLIVAGIVPMLADIALWQCKGASKRRGELGKGMGQLLEPAYRVHNDLPGAITKKIRLRHEVHPRDNLMAIERISQSLQKSIKIRRAAQISRSDKLMKRVVTFLHMVKGGYQTIPGIAGEGELIRSGKQCRVHPAIGFGGHVVVGIPLVSQRCLDA